jgi:hypothetical protein
MTDEKYMNHIDEEGQKIIKFSCHVRQFTYWSDDHPIISRVYWQVELRKLSS